MNAATNDGLTGGSAAPRKSDFTQLERQKTGRKEQVGRAAGRDLQHWFRLADVTLGFINPSSSFFFSIRTNFYSVCQCGVPPVLIEKLIVINLLRSALPGKQSLSSASDGIFMLLV